MHKQFITDDEVKEAVLTYFEYKNKICFMNQLKDLKYIRLADEYIE